MASIKGKKSQHTLPARPGWLVYFCHDLADMYGCTENDLKKRADLDWLDLFQSVSQNLPNTLTAVLAPPTGSGLPIDIKPDEVKYDSSPQKPLTPQAAMEMALLAMANPAMEDGVVLEGTNEEKQMLEYACLKLGLNVLNPVTPITDLQLQQNMTSVAANFPNAMAQAVPGHRTWSKMRVKSNIIDNNVLASNVQIALGKVDRNLYKQVKEKVWTDQRVSKNSLATDFNINASDAGRLLDAMEQESFIYQPTQGTYHACIDRDCRWVPQ